MATRIGGAWGPAREDWSRKHQPTREGRHDRRAQHRPATVPWPASGADHDRGRRNRGPRPRDFKARGAGLDAEAQRTKLLGVYAMLVGTLQLSRALTDSQLADAVLEQGVQNVVQILRSLG